MEEHVGSDDVPGTYAHWLRDGTMYWNPDAVPPTLEFKVIQPFKRGPLLDPSKDSRRGSGCRGQRGRGRGGRRARGSKGNRERGHRHQ